MDELDVELFGEMPVSLFFPRRTFISLSVIDDIVLTLFVRKSTLPLPPPLSHLLNILHLFRHLVASLTRHM